MEQMKRENDNILWLSTFPCECGLYMDIPLLYEL